MSIDVSVEVDNGPEEPKEERLSDFAKGTLLDEKEARIAKLVQEHEEALAEVKHAAEHAVMLVRERLEEAQTTLMQSAAAHESAKLDVERAREYVDAFEIELRAARMRLEEAEQYARNIAVLREGDGDKVRELEAELEAAARPYARSLANAQKDYDRAKLRLTRVQLRKRLIEKSKESK